VPALLDKRLILVTGKGGAGKTTVAAALGLGGVLGEQPDERLHYTSVDPELAKQEWLRYQLKSRTLAGVLGGSRLFQYLTAAAPGLTELVTMGKVWDLAQLEPRTGGPAFDLAIVDAPATGHGLAMLRAPSTFASIARVGPVGRHAQRIDSFIRDATQTGVLSVALPEEMPVNETVEFERALRRELDIAVDLIVVNAVHPARFRPDEIRAIQAVAGGSRVTSAALSAAVSEHTRARGEHGQVRRLRRAAGAPVATLPRIFEPELGPEELERLSVELERRL
jgi:anion-transporting  ArsA/GET3 family ATPase